MVQAHKIGGLYDRMEFPEYKFREYPKFLGYKSVNGQRVEIIAQSQTEELALIATGQLPGPEHPLKEENSLVAAQLAAQQAENARLIAEMNELKEQFKSFAQQAARSSTSEVEGVPEEAPKVASPRTPTGTK